MTKTYSFDSPVEMSDEALSDILSDLMACATKANKEGRLVNAKRLELAAFQIESVIDRNRSEMEFLGALS